LWKRTTHKQLSETSLSRQSVCEGGGIATRPSVTKRARRKLPVRERGGPRRRKSAQDAKSEQFPKVRNQSCKMGRRFAYSRGEERERMFSWTGGGEVRHGKGPSTVRDPKVPRGKAHNKGRHKIGVNNLGKNE